MIDAPGARVMVVGGVWRGRFGVVVSAPDRTNSVRVTMDKRSKYDEHKPHEWAWVPVDFLRIRGQ